MDQRRIHPKALQSSMEYDQYLRAKLADGVGEGEASNMASRRRVRDRNSSERSSLTRQTAASMSRMRSKGYRGKEREGENEQLVFEPLRHSWRRHIEPPQSTPLTFDSPSRCRDGEEKMSTSATPAVPHFCLRIYSTRISQTAPKF